MKSEIFKKTTCRVCTGTKLTKVITVGPSPLANEFLPKEKIDLAESFYPLDVYFCEKCSFLQLGHVVDPQILFGNYVYVSSTSPVFVKHFQDFAAHIVEKFGLTKKNLVVDIGSNDGILLKPYKKIGIKVLGVEPAKHIARIAKKDGVDTIADWFTNKVAKQVVQKKGKAAIITGTNVFAHIDDLDEVLRGVSTLLDDDGVFITESPYLIDFIEKRYFDLIYHEHVSYWAVKTIGTLFKRFDMKIIDVEKVAAHGGSIRVFAAKNASKHKVTSSVKEFLMKEKELKLENINTYIEYNKIIQENKIKLLDMLGKLKKDGKRIAGYGAPAKGNTLLNFFSIGTEILDYIIEDNPMKQGLYTPGRRIPVVAPSYMRSHPVDYLLLLAWNFAEPLMKKNAAFKEKGGSFIVPVPKPRIL